MKLGCVQVYLLCHFQWAAPLTSDCPYKECSCEETVIMCNNMGLVTIPRKTISNNTHFIDGIFDRNQITTITAGSLPANMSQITFMENPITTIEDDAFNESANTLTSLRFSYSRFIRLPDAFLRLNALKLLAVSESIIEDWNVEVMKHIGPTLRTISIENIALNTWPAWLQYFSSLTDLTMTGCSISDIPDEGLDTQIKSLINLRLTNNSLTNIPMAVSNLTSLYVLYLDINNIADAKWLPQSSPLKSLALNDNKLHDANQLGILLRAYSNTLADFEIQDNLLTSFPDLDFLPLILGLNFNQNRLVDPNSGSFPPGLIELEMAHNSLPRIPRILSGVQKITEVLVGSNAITVIEGITFPALTENVELQFNLITQITDTSFVENSRIRFMALNNNPLVTVSENAFKNLPHLLELNLQYTKLARLPLALISLVNMDSFDITNTDSLVCTCLEKSLKQWIMSLKADRVKGSCGETSIYYFYSELSSDCP